MQTKHATNSDDYWNSRFAEDWESAQGPAQSRFFAKLAIENLPHWFLDQLQREPLTLCDWGCAQGDGADVWASYVDSERITGVDFSSVAIEQAARRYSNIRFLNEDWLAFEPDEQSVFDVVFSSNTLEHFEKPHDVLKFLCSRASKALVFALPYRELNRNDEHFYTFLPENIPSIIDGGFKLIWSKVVDCRQIPKTLWGGDQIVLVYAKSCWVDSLGLTLNDLCIEQSDFQTAISDLNQALAERDGQIASLKKALAERDGQIYLLNDKVMKIKESISWRITSPIRASKYLFAAFFRKFYSVARSIYWCLPSGLKNFVNRSHHLFSRGLRKGVLFCDRVVKKTTNKDMSWCDFQGQILNQGEFYGVFIQDAVIEWGIPMYQRPQQIAVALGKLGYLVIYKTTASVYDNVSGFRKVAENVWITDRSEIFEIHGAVRSFYSGVLDVLPEKDERKMRMQTWVYEYVDQIDEEIAGDSISVRKLIEQKRKAFSGAVDYVVSSAKKLHQEAVQSVGDQRALLIPNGVDVLHYRNPRHANTKVPESLLNFKKGHEAIVGYFGAVAPWLWYECIHDLVKMHPEFGFVFIGVDYLDCVKSLPNCSNVLYLGAVDYKVLPSYAQQFDVCFIPFKPGDIAATTSPLKLFEYFSLEKPVVVTSVMDECTVYPEVFRGGSSIELSIAIRQALEIKDSVVFKSKLRRLADQNDWYQRALLYEKVFGKHESIAEVQGLIRECHRLDKDNKTYYEDAYMATERFYWRPVPLWIDDIQHVDSVIDVGAVYGTLLTYVALNKGCQDIYAIDPVGYMSKNLQQKLGIKLIRMDFEREDFTLPAKFDLVIFTEVIEHLNFHPLPTLLKLKKILKPGGKVVLTTPDAQEWGRVTDYYPSLDVIPEYDGRDSKWIDGHIWQYSKNELDNLVVKAGFKIERFDYSPGVVGRHLCYMLSIKS